MKEKKIIALMATAVLVSACGSKKESKEKAPTRVKTEVVVAGSQTTDQTYVGIVEENEATVVSFTGMGVVKRVLVSEGQAVGKGQLLAVMDDTQARNLLSGAEAQMAQAEDALQRYGLLHDAGSMTEAQWVEIQSKVAQARSQLAVARKNVADCQLKAPVSGIIGSYEGGCIEKGVVADALTHTYDVRIAVSNSDRKLLPGMVASVQFAEAQPQPAGQLSVPVTAVQRQADGSLFVWTVDKDSTAHRTAVTTGSTQGNRIRLNEGIAEGQRIVTEGYQKLSEGTRVIF